MTRAVGTLDTQADIIEGQLGKVASKVVGRHTLADLAGHLWLVAEVPACATPVHPLPEVRVHVEVAEIV